MTVGRIFTNVYLGLFFENRQNLDLTSGQNDDPVSRTWKMTQMTHWPGDPMTQFHVWWQVRSDAFFRQNYMTTFY